MWRSRIQAAVNDGRTRLLLVGDQEVALPGLDQANLPAVPERLVEGFRHQLFEGDAADARQLSPLLE